MCNQNIKKRLLNGEANSMEAQSEGIANLMDSSDKILDFLHQFKAEVLEYIDNSLSIHAKSCGAARTAATQQKPDEKNSLKLAIGKFLGFEAQGKVGMALSALFWALVGAVAFGIILNAAEVYNLVNGGTP